MYIAYIFHVECLSLEAAWLSLQHWGEIIMIHNESYRSVRSRVCVSVTRLYYNHCDLLVDCRSGTALHIVRVRQGRGAIKYSGCEEAGLRYCVGVGVGGGVVNTAWREMFLLGKYLLKRHAKVGLGRWNSNFQRWQHLEQDPSEKRKISPSELLTR